jgi:rare lipoprotein A
MYKMTAAHPTLPIPSYARITNLSNGTQVIVRINDRGPFHSSRVIDLSYAAALKLGYLGTGSSELEVERLLPDDIAQINATRQTTQQTTPDVTTVVVPVPAPAPPPPATSPVQIPQTAALASTAVTIPATTSSPPPTNTVSARSAPAFSDNEPASGYYVQLGAFTEIGNAEAVRSRLMQSWDNSLPPLEVISVGVFYRLHSGPYASRTEAASAAQKVQTNSDIKPLVVQR